VFGPVTAHALITVKIFHAESKNFANISSYKRPTATISLKNCVHNPTFPWEVLLIFKILSKMELHYILKSNFLIFCHFLSCSFDEVTIVNNGYDINSDSLQLWCHNLTAPPAVIQEKLVWGHCSQLSDIPDLYMYCMPMCCGMQSEHSVLSHLCKFIW
jgi:hypothetical protein